MQIGNFFRSYPAHDLQQVLWRWIGAQDFIYNCKTKEDRYFRSFASKALSLVGQYPPVDQAYSHFRNEEMTWMTGVPSQILRNGAVNWFITYQRFFKKLCKRPTMKSKHGRRSVTVSNELFRFQKNAKTGDWEIELGTPKKPVGTLPIRAHREFEIPKTIVISCHNGDWHVSFSYDNNIPEPSDNETAAYLRQFSEAELTSMTVGVDRGVTQPFMTSQGQVFGLSDVQKARVEKKEKYKAKHQKRFARCKPGSKRQNKALQRIRRCQRYINNVYKDVSHQTSNALVSDQKIKLLVVEDLKIANMTKSATGSVAKPGKNVAQKTGLNKAILGSMWGKTILYTQYKARRLGKLVIKVPAHHSSQECAKCSHIYAGNRPTRDRFHCQRCGHQDDADHNAAIVIKMRGIRRLLSEEPSTKAVTKVTKVRKQKSSKVGAECSEPAALLPKLSGDAVSHETEVNLLSAVQVSMKRETPTTTQCV